MQTNTSFRIAALAACLTSTQAIQVDAAKNSVNIDLGFDVNIVTAKTADDSEAAALTEEVAAADAENESSEVKAAGDKSNEGEQFCWNCEEGTDKTDLSEVLPGWVFVEPQPDSSMSNADDKLNLAQIMVGQLDRLEKTSSTNPSEIEISQKVRDEKLCPDTWMLGAISEEEVMCFPTWPVMFDPEVGCPDDQKWAGVGCCMKQEWLEIDAMEAMDDVSETFEDYLPSRECPPQWVLRPDIDFCVPFWTQSEPSQCETAESECEGGFEFDEVWNLCLLPRELISQTQIGRNDEGLFQLVNIKDCPEEWTWSETLSSCIPDDLSATSGTVGFWIDNPQIVNCAPGLTFSSTLNSCVPEEILAPPSLIGDAAGESIDCPVGWTWDPCLLSCAADLPNLDNLPDLDDLPDQDDLPDLDDLPDQDDLDLNDLPDLDDEDDLCVCPEIYEPVECDGEEYSNSCFAACDGALDCLPLEEEDEDCICIEIYEPVFCRD